MRWTEGPAEAWLADTHDGEPVKLTPEETWPWKHTLERRQVPDNSCLPILRTVFGLVTQFLH